MNYAKKVYGALTRKQPQLYNNFMFMVEPKVTAYKRIGRGNDRRSDLYQKKMIPN